MNKLVHLLSVSSHTQAKVNLTYITTPITITVNLVRSGIKDGDDPHIPDVKTVFAFIIYSRLSASFTISPRLYSSSLTCGLCTNVLPYCHRLSCRISLAPFLTARHTPIAMSSASSLTLFQSTAFTFLTLSTSSLFHRSFAISSMPARSTRSLGGSTSGGGSVILVREAAERARRWDCSKRLCRCRRMVRYSVDVVRVSPESWWGC